MKDHCIDVLTCEWTHGMACAFISVLHVRPSLVSHLYLCMFFGMPMMCRCTCVCVCMCALARERERELLGFLYLAEIRLKWPDCY